jgi:hypothetical protein
MGNYFNDGDNSFHELELKLPKCKFQQVEKRLLFYLDNLYTYEVKPLKVASDLASPHLLDSI